MSIHGKNTGVAINDYDITRWLNQVSSGDTVDTAESTCFDEPGSAKAYVAGMREGKASWSGRFTSELDPLKTVMGVFADIEDAGDDVPLTIAIDRGFVRGRQCSMGRAWSTTLTATSPISDVVSVTGDLQANGGFRAGVILTEKDPVTATTTFDSVDGGVGTTSSGSAHLHVDARNSSNGTVDVRIQDSADNSVWADLIVFTQVPALSGSGQRIELADNAPIGRYTRAIATLSGTTGSAVIRVALSRRK